MGRGFLSFLHGRQGFTAVFHELHQSDAHEIWFGNPVISFRVLAKAQENGVDGHAVDANKAVDDHVGEQGG